MSEVLLALSAEDDLQDIWDFLAREADISIADQTLIRIQDALREIAAFPSAGKSRDDLRENLRSFVFKSYVFYYYPRESGIEVYRVLHAARDVSWLLYQ